MSVLQPPNPINESIDQSASFSCRIRPCELRLAARVDKTRQLTSSHSQPLMVAVHWFEYTDTHADCGIAVRKAG